MKFQQLRYLVAVHENGLNITAAARQLHTSQPGVSRQLKLLEEENRRLKQLVADLSLDKVMLQDVLRKKL